MIVLHIWTLKNQCGITIEWCTIWLYHILFVFCTILSQLASSTCCVWGKIHACFLLIVVHGKNCKAILKNTETALNQIIVIFHLFAFIYRKIYLVLEFQNLRGFAPLSWKYFTYGLHDVKSIIHHSRVRTIGYIQIKLWITYKSMPFSSCHTWF